MLAVLLNVPRSPADWSEFSFHNYLEHQDIAAQLQAKKSVTVLGQVIDPIDFGDFQNWAERHDLLHTQINNVLGTTNYDFGFLDPNDERDVVGWIWLHALQHRDWATILA